MVATISNQSARCASFSPDGNLIAACQGNEIVLFNLELNTLLQQGCDSLHNYLVTNPKVSDEEVELCSKAKSERQKKQNN